MGHCDVITMADFLHAPLYGLRRKSSKGKLPITLQHLQRHTVAEKRSGSALKLHAILFPFAVFGCPGQERRKTTSFTIITLAARRVKGRHRSPLRRACLAIPYIFGAIWWRLSAFHRIRLLLGRRQFSYHPTDVIESVTAD